MPNGTVALQSTFGTYLTAIMYPNCVTQGRLAPFSHVRLFLVTVVILPALTVATVGTWRVTVWITDGLPSGPPHNCASPTGVSCIAEAMMS